MIEFDENGFATSSGSMAVHRICDTTREWLGRHDEYMSIGTGLARGSYLKGPEQPAADGFVWCRNVDDSGWWQVEDLRGKLAYDKATRAATEITDLGSLPDTHTMLAPSSPYDHWNGQAWVLDEAAEQQAKKEAAQTEQAKRIALANQQIAIIKPAVDGGYAKPEHTKLLADWQRYRYELTLAPEQPGWPDNPQWPDQPATVI